jgi:ABC-type dipeptide/oligopeptide/nickel transport system ATPase subunit
MSDQVLVMNQGRIEEIADVTRCTPILKKNIQKMLIEAIPTGSKD